MEKGVQPNGHGAGDDSIATFAPDAKTPSPPVQFSDAGDMGNPVAAGVFPSAEHNAHNPLAPMPDAEKARETVAPPAAVPDSSSLDGKQKPVPAPPADPAGESTARSVSVVAGRGSKSVKDSAARPAELRIAGDSGREERKSVANESFFLNPPAKRDADAMAGMAGKHGNTPEPVAGTNPDPFDALDVSRTVAPPALIRAGAHHAEAGYLDPALGWISVRADAAPNGVHAALVPPSAEAAQALGSHLAGLTAYLSEHHREPATVTIAAPHDGRDGTAAGPGTHAGQGDSPRQDDAPDRHGLNDKAPVAIPRSPHRAPETTAVHALAEGARYISVVA